MQIEVIDFKNSAQIETQMRDIGVTTPGIQLMVPKFIFKTIKLTGIRNAMANILKQEMLSLGGEAAVHRDAVNCRIEQTDVLLGGTLKMYTKLVEKLRMQVSELREIAEMLNEELQI